MALYPTSTQRGMTSREGSSARNRRVQEVRAMTACRALPLVALIVIVAMPLEAGAQPGGVPGEGHVDAPPTGMPPACQRLVAMRDEVQKRGLAIQKANERKAPVQEACRLFGAY